MRNSRSRISRLSRMYKTICLSDVVIVDSFTPWAFPKGAKQPTQGLCNNSEKDSLRPYRFIASPKGLYLNNLDNI